MTNSSDAPGRGALGAWTIAAAGFLVAALCLASLSFDGSYYLLRTLQAGVPAVAHHRWLNWLMLSPLLWAKPFVSGPLPLAALHGLLCAAVPLASLAVCLGMLRGRFAPLRLWALCGILLAPLPGQIVMVSEVSMAIQTGWVCLAFVCCGCTSRWAPAALLAMAATWGLHPVAAVLFGMAFLLALMLGMVCDAGSRRRFILWSAIFAIAALAKGGEVALLATDYERANLEPGAWLAECYAGLVETPFVAILLAFAALVLGFRCEWKGLPGSPRLQRCLWGVAFMMGVGYGLFPAGWAGTLSYRKFGILVTVPLVLMAGMKARRIWKNDGLAARGEAALQKPALLFAVTLVAMSLSWKGLCVSFGNRLAACPDPVQTHEALSLVERRSALDHWSATSLSLVMQGWAPKKVHVWNGSLQQAGGVFSVCPRDYFEWADRAFALAWIGRLEPTSAFHPVRE